jgi:hypothetical protein
MLNPYEKEKQYAAKIPVEYHKLKDEVNLGLIYFLTSI